MNRRNFLSLAKYGLGCLGLTKIINLNKLSATNSIDSSNSGLMNLRPITEPISVFEQILFKSNNIPEFPLDFIHDIKEYVYYTNTYYTNKTFITTRKANPNFVQVPTYTIEAKADSKNEIINSIYKKINQDASQLLFSVAKHNKFKPEFDNIRGLKFQLSRILNISQTNNRLKIKDRKSVV